MFIYPVSCVLNVDSAYGLSILDCPLGFLTHEKETLEKTEGTNKNGQSRGTVNMSTQVTGHITLEKTEGAIKNG
jgi:hypothetical protein